MTERPDDLLEPDEHEEVPPEKTEEDDELGLAAEESLGLLPPD